MARIKWYDTLKGWNERGYRITKGSKAKRHDAAGEALFSWGQVVPSSYVHQDYNNDNDELIEGEDYPEPDRFYGDLD